MAGLPGTNEEHGQTGTTPASYSKSINAREVAEQDDWHEGKDLRPGDGREEGGDEHEEGPLTEIHETAANLLYLLILLHITGVIFETRRGGRQVVLAMLPGHR